MYIAVDDKEIVPKYFAVCDFYDAEICLCWDNADKLVIFPYTKDSTMDNPRILMTPAPVRKVQSFNGRAFVICTPQGAYKLSRTGEFALLSKNALSMGGEFFQVLVAWNNNVYLDNKQNKTSMLLFPLIPNEIVCTFSLILPDTEVQLVNCFAAGWKIEDNLLCIVAHYRKLYVLRDDAIQLIYTSDVTIVDILPAMKNDKVAGLLLLTEHTNVVILVHGRNNKLIYEKIHLGEKMRDGVTFCASFSPSMENILWMVCCNRSKMYYLKKELCDDTIVKVKVEERSFTCIRYYKPNIILCLSQNKELVELSLEELENSLSKDNNIPLHTGMFERTDIIMEKICVKVKQLTVIYESLTDKQDKLKRINLYATNQKLQTCPCIEVFRLCKYVYLGISIPDKPIPMPKNSHVVFSYTSKNQNVFCIKKIAETALTIQMPINENRILCSSSINMDLITLTNEQRPWCLIQNFVLNSPPQDLKRKRTLKKDKTAFINTKIASLQHLIEKRELSITKLSEMKRNIRLEL